MKPLHIIIICAFFAIAGGSFYYTNFAHKGANEYVSEEKPKVETPQDTITLYKEYGEVAFKNKTTDTFIVLKDQKTQVANYTTVRTGNGRGYVIFPDNSSITLATGTEIEISYEPTKVSILQIVGSTYHRVTALVNGNKYEIRTPNTLAAIRGTKLAVTYNPSTKKTNVLVTEHQVEVTPTKNDGTPSKAPVMVKQGSFANIQSSTSTTKAEEKMVVKTNDEMKEPAIKIFMDENKIIDKEYDKVPPEQKVEFMERMISTIQKENEEVPTTDDTQPQTKTTTRVETITRVIKVMNETTSPTTSTTKVETTKPTTSTTNSTTETKTTSDIPITTTSPRSQTTDTQTPSRTLIPFPTDKEELSSNEQNFIDIFYATYEKYFFVDEPQAYCKKIGQMKAQDLVNTLLMVGNTSGFIIPRQTDLSVFATDLVNACADGNMTSKASTFKTRFDTTYPF